MMAVASHRSPPQKSSWLVSYCIIVLFLDEVNNLPRVNLRVSLSPLHSVSSSTMGGTAPKPTPWKHTLYVA